MPSTRRPKVLIIGAGMGGLALAQGLRKNKIPFEIFERDSSAKIRRQGWAISLQWIIEELLSTVPEDMPPLKETSVTAPLGLETVMAIYDAYRATKLRIPESRHISGHSIRVNRARFREWLSTGLNIQWNKRLQSFDESSESVRAYFDDGTSAEGDLLIGADGIDSDVRAILLQPNPPVLNTIPIGILVGEVTLTPEQYTRQLELGRSFHMAFGKEKRFFTAPKSIAADRKSALYHWLLSWNDPEALKGTGYWTHHATHQEQLDFARGKISDFHERFQEILKYQTADGMLERPLIVRDLVLEELPGRRVTLLGDAAHAMTFFRGEGANHAMQDAMNLSKALNVYFGLNQTTSDQLGAIPKIIQTYQSEMLQRGVSAVLKSREAAT